VRIPFMLLVRLKSVELRQEEQQHTKPLSVGG
jgi:hypothetical protein